MWYDLAIMYGEATNSIISVGTIEGYLVSSMT